MVALFAFTPLGIQTEKALHGLAVLFGYVQEKVSRYLIQQHQPWARAWVPRVVA